MTKIEIEIYDDVIEVLNKVINTNDSGVELDIPEGSILFENVLNLKLIKKYADKFSITVHFLTNDPAGNNLLEMIESGGNRFDQQNESIEISAINKQENSTINATKSGGMSGMMNKLSGLKMRTTAQRLPKFKYYILPMLIALALVGGFHFTQTRRTAHVKIDISSQPLARSLTIKVKAGSASDAEQKVLSGSNVKSTVELTEETEATGEKIVGEKAKGKAKIYNKTEDEKTFKKGNVLNYENDDDVKFKYVLRNDVTVPARTEEILDPLDPPKITPGEAEVDIEANDVGAEFNIESGELLTVEGEKSADFSGVTKDDISGGKKETVTIVSELDLKTINDKLDSKTADAADTQLKSKVETSQNLIEGSSKNTIIKSTPTHQIGDEADKVSITRVIEVEGLVYLKSELDRLLESMVQEFIPQGFVLSSKERQINVEVLGNSSNSVLTSTEADLQVTLKTYIVPNIDEDEIKEAIAGKGAKAVNEILNSIQNVEAIEFTMDRALLPFLYKVPNDKDKITIEIVRE